MATTEQASHHGAGTAGQESDDLLKPLLGARRKAVPEVIVDAGNGQTTGTTTGVVIGEIIAFSNGVPLVSYPGQPGAAAVRARSVVDVHGVHVGRQVVLTFENADSGKPIVMGWLRGEQSAPEVQAPGSVEIDADGERLVVTARHQLVLRCGEASITMTKAGKVLIQGTYVSSRSSGVNRIKGGSVQIN